ncbi:MAG: sodium:solute symporter [Acidobacteria bacterium]|nr:sodium:solute symporter [Acidobacteriota bacterium]
MHTVALAVFCLFFLLVTLAGFWAARWRRPKEGIASLEEWGLAGRSFGTWITWFLVGGDLYTAYTVIAVPAALYGAGAMGFFALPYAIITYPYMMLVLPRLWRVCHRHGYVTFADFIGGRYGNRWLTLAIALTGILALMPYIALQLVGMRVVLSAMGLHGEWPLAAAFIILAAYTYSSGLRAPAVIAIVKDVMLYIMVIAAIVVIPIKLGGYAHVFHVASQALATHTPAAGINLKPGQFLGYSTLAIGSALALMLYPHTATAVLSAQNPNVVRRNAAMMPAYSFLLGLVALLGYLALAAGIDAKGDTSSAVPLLFLQSFPEWFAGFCLAAVAIGALVPAAIMSIAASNLFTRNVYGLFSKTKMLPHQESNMAKLVSLVIKFGALAFVLWLPTPYAIEMQLLGGIWICQMVPSVVVGVFTRWFHPWALVAGWAAGMASGTAMAVSLSLKSSVYPLHLPAWLGGTWAMYAAVPALLLNFAIAGALTLVFRSIGFGGGEDTTDASVYVG